MNCESVQELLPLYLSNELTGEDLTAVQLHIHACRTCSQALSLDRELDDALRTAMLEQSPDVSLILDRVNSKITATGWKRFLHVGWVRAGALVAAIVVIAVLSVSTFNAHQLQRTIGLAAANDHYSDLVLLRHPDWLYQPQEVAGFMQEQFSQQELLSSITPSDATFEKVRLCNLGGTQYAHFVFRTGSTETSVFLLPNNKPRKRHDSIHLADAGHGLEVSEFSSPELTGMVVGNKGQVPTQAIASRLAGVL